MMYFFMTNIVREKYGVKGVSGNCSQSEQQSQKIKSLFFNIQNWITNAMRSCYAAQCFLHVMLSLE